MRIIEMYQNQPFVFSIEVFPPKTEEGMENLQKKLRTFSSFKPDYISVTYGAGGGTRQNTQQLASSHTTGDWSGLKPGTSLDTRIPISSNWPAA